MTRYCVKADRLLREVSFYQTNSLSRALRAFSAFVEDAEDAIEKGSVEIDRVTLEDNGRVSASWEATEDD